MISGSEYLTDMLNFHYNEFRQIIEIRNRKDLYNDRKEKKFIGNGTNQI